MVEEILFLHSNTRGRQKEGKGGASALTSCPTCVDVLGGRKREQHMPTLLEAADRSVYLTPTRLPPGSGARRLCFYDMLALCIAYAADIGDQGAAQHSGAAFAQRSSGGGGWPAVMGRQRLWA